MSEHLLDINSFIQYLEPERYGKIIQVLNARTDYVTVLMENFFDPRNIAAVIRSCDAFGVQRIHVVEQDNRFFIGKHVCKGSQHWVNIYKYQSSETAVKNLKKQGYTILIADPRPENPALHQLELNSRTALVFGQEKNGIRPETRALADGAFRIPIAGFAESFNVSVACAITLHTLLSKLRENPPAGFFLPESEKKKILQHWLVRNTLIGRVLRKLNKQQHYFLKEPNLIV